MAVLHEGTVGMHAATLLSVLVYHAPCFSLRLCSAAAGGNAALLLHIILLVLLLLLLLLLLTTDCSPAAVTASILE
jgi:hypothetical protein